MLIIGPPTIYHLKNPNRVKLFAAALIHPRGAVRQGEAGEAEVTKTSRVKTADRFR